MKRYYKVQIFTALGPLIGDREPRWVSIYRFDTLQECKDYYNTFSPKDRKPFRVIEHTERIIEL